MDVTPLKRPFSHTEYTGKGYCSSIHWTQAWCVQPDGHDRDHFSVFLRPDGLLEVGIRWD